MVVELPEALSGVVEELSEYPLDVLKDGPDVLLGCGDVNCEGLLALELGLELGVVLSDLPGPLLNGEIQLCDIIAYCLNLLYCLLPAVFKLVNPLQYLVDLALLGLC